MLLLVTCSVAMTTSLTRLTRDSHHAHWRCHLRHHLCGRCAAPAQASASQGCQWRCHHLVCVHLDCTLSPWLSMTDVTVIEYERHGWCWWCGQATAVEIEIRTVRGALRLCVLCGDEMTRALVLLGLPVTRVCAPEDTQRTSAAHSSSLDQAHSATTPLTRPAD